MSPTAVTCPHCGARQADRDPLPLAERPRAPLAGTSLSNDEVAALLAVSSAASAPAPETYAPGLFQLALLPHPATRGAARATEVALTVGSAALVLGGIVLFAFSARRLLRFIRGATAGDPEIGAALVTIGIGGIGLTATLGLAGVGFSAAAAIAGVCAIATVARMLIRRAASGPTKPRLV